MTVRACEELWIHLGFNCLGSHTRTAAQSRLSAAVDDTLIIFCLLISNFAHGLQQKVVKAEGQE